MDSELTGLIAQCAAVVEGQAPIIAGLFLAGLAGSLTHCTGMCGPFALSQTGARLAGAGTAGPEGMRRFKASLLLPYHLGRLTTYALLGAALSLPVGFALTAGGIWWLPPVMLSVAALLFVSVALGLLHTPGIAGQLYQGFGVTLARLGRPLFSKPYSWNGYALGLLLGLLPCGLVYAALAGATAGGDPLVASLGMAAFGAGTMPALFAVAYGGSWLMPRVGFDPRRAAPYVALGNAAFLTALAIDMAVRA